MTYTPGDDVRTQISLMAVLDGQKWGTARPPTWAAWHTGTCKMTWKRERIERGSGSREQSEQPKSHHWARKGCLQQHSPKRAGQGVPCAAASCCRQHRSSGPASHPLQLGRHLQGRGKQCRGECMTPTGSSCIAQLGCPHAELAAHQPTAEVCHPTHSSTMPAIALYSSTHQGVEVAADVKERVRLGNGLGAAAHLFKLGPPLAKPAADDLWGTAKGGRAEVWDFGTQRWQVSQLQKQKVHGMRGGR